MFKISIRRAHKDSRKDEDPEPKKRRARSPKFESPPSRLFHATSAATARRIVLSGSLEPRTSHRGSTPYLCAAESSGGASSGNPHPTDVVFRIRTSRFPHARWWRSSAEWRTRESLDASLLEWRLVHTHGEWRDADELLDSDSDSDSDSSSDSD